MRTVNPTTQHTDPHDHDDDEDLAVVSRNLVRTLIVLSFIEGLAIAAVVGALVWLITAMR